MMTAQDWIGLAECGTMLVLLFGFFGVVIYNLVKWR